MERKWNLTKPGEILTKAERFLPSPDSFPGNAGRILSNGGRILTSVLTFLVSSNRFLVSFLRILFISNAFCPPVETFLFNFGAISGFPGCFLISLACWLYLPWWGFDLACLFFVPPVVEALQGYRQQKNRLAQANRLLSFFADWNNLLRVTSVLYYRFFESWLLL